MIPIQGALPNRYPPFFTWGLIGVNTLSFLYQAALPPEQLEAFLYNYALVPARYAYPQWADWVGLPPDDYLPFFTNMYLHGGWLHLILNMWTLYIFGPAIEDRLGAVRFFAFYSFCGVAASFAHAIVNLDSTIPALGASGAIAGVLGAYMRLFPLAQVIVVIPILFLPFFMELPAAVFAGIWFLMQVLQGIGDVVSPSMGGGVAWWAHIGGFIAGFAVIRLLHRRARRYRVYYADEGYMGFKPSGRR